MIGVKDPNALAAFWVGTICVILGGLIAAVASPLSLDKGSWAAAYLVLPAGVVQVIIAWARVFLAGEDKPAGGFWVGFACWNAGNAAVILGTLAHSPAVVVAGAVLLVVAILQQLWQVRGTDSSRTWQLWVYRLIMVVLLVSIPVGSVLSALRN